MNQHHLWAKIRLTKYKFNHETVLNIYEDNLLSNDYTTTNSQQKWMMDINYIKTAEGTLYLNMIRDVHSQSIIAYKMSNLQKFETLVKPCIKQAVKLFNYQTDNIILHTDNGPQYRCYEFYQLASKYKIRTSKSRPHTSTDNGLAENFFSHLSAEWIKNQIYDTLSKAQKDIENYIHFYNHERIFMKFENNPWNNLKFSEKYSYGI